MSKAATSPTARLLQNSRLFSLPRPLPAPPLENISSATGIYRASDTATLPYPTHQAVVTPPSSHFRGDWGLKRPLPARATRSSSATIRVRAQDTPEHITDFGSATDHSQTWRKWQEMGVPLLLRQVKKDKTPPPMSVFEDRIDNTDPAVTKSPVAEKSRWKYTGPWIVGMQSGEFEQWLRGFAAKRGRDGVKALVGRSKIDEWREHLRTHLLEKRLAKRKRVAQDEGEQLGPTQLAELRDSLLPGDPELRKYEKNLRDDHIRDNLSSELTALIVSFLDLPPAAISDSELVSGIKQAHLRSVVSSLEAESSDIPPPSTHPSAGLGYTRSNAVMENHPLYGPQAHRAPFLARVVRPRNGSSGVEFQAKLGVGGVVANDPISQTRETNSTRLAPGDPSTHPYDPERMSHAIDPDLEGGNKMWVHPRQALIDEKGRIQLDVHRGDREAVSVRKGNVHHIHQEKAASLSTMGSATSSFGPVLYAANAKRYKPGTEANANYGFSLSGPEPPVKQTTVPTSGVQGFDDSAVERIREVLEGGRR